MKREIYKTRQEKRDLFNHLQLEYLSRVEINFPGFEKMDWASSPYYRTYEGEFLELIQRYGDQLSQGYLTPCSIRNNPKGMGYGLYCEAPLKEGDLLGIYTGVLQEALPEVPLNPEKTRFSTDYAWDYPDALNGFPELEVNALTKGNELRFVNHSFQPNVDVDHTLYKGEWVLLFIANRDIAPEEEFFVDYGEDYWTCEWRTLIL